MSKVSVQSIGKYNPEQFSSISKKKPVLKQTPIIKANKISPVEFTAKRRSTPKSSKMNDVELSPLESPLPNESPVKSPYVKQPSARTSPMEQPSVKPPSVKPPSVEQQTPEKEKLDLLSKYSQQAIKGLQQTTGNVTSGVQDFVKNNTPPEPEKKAPVDHLAYHFKKYVTSPGRKQLKNIAGRTKNIFANLEQRLDSAKTSNVGGGRISRKTKRRNTRSNRKKRNTRKNKKHNKSQRKQSKRRRIRKTSKKSTKKQPRTSRKTHKRHSKKK